jgi:transcriptional regulator with XRE-family HTH domain
VKHDQKDCIEVGKRIRQLRKFYQLKQEDFANRIKIHQSTLALFESGDRLLKEIYVKIICSEFDCNQEWLLYGKGEMIVKGKTATLEEYAKRHNLSKLEREIIKTYMEIDKDTRQEIIDKFSHVFMDARFDSRLMVRNDIMNHEKNENKNEKK